MSIVPTLLLLVAQAAEPDRVTLTGTVIDVDGKPAAGAEVVLADDAPWRRLSVLIGSSGAVLRPPAVLRRQATDAEGRFRVDLPGPSLTFARVRRPFFLWAMVPRGTLALRPIPEDWPMDGEPVRLVLARPEALRFVVLDPEGRPAPGVRLAPARICDADLPAELDGRFAVETDAQGRATLAVGLAGEVERIRLASGPFGIQQVRVPRPDADGVRTLRLWPVGRVVGRIEAGDPAAVRGLAVRVRTDPDPADDLAGVGGSATVVTDDRGRFAIPALAAGTLRLSFEPRWELPWRGNLAGRPEVRPGSTFEVAIPLKRAVKVSGVVQEIATGRPIAGAGVLLTPIVETPLAMTDAEGRYSGYVLPPGMAYRLVHVEPRGYYVPSGSISNRRPVAEGMAEITMDPIGLARAADLQGRVIDAKGEPVPGAEVAGYYFPNSLSRAVHAVADRRGRFRIVNLPPTTSVHLSAARGLATTAAPVSAAPVGGAVALTIRPENSVALLGRVKDPGDRPVAGAWVRVSARGRGPQDRPIEQFQVTFDDEGRTAVRTGPDGRFRTPKRLRPDLEYRVEVEADGHAPAGTEWIKPGDDRAFASISAIVLVPTVPVRAVSGRVVDSRGRPVAGAVVFQSGDGPARTRATTDADGRFRLPGIYREPAFLFVEGPGLAFEGHRIGPDVLAVELRTRRDGEPAGPPLRTLPPLLPRDREIALARRLIGDDLSPITGPNATAETHEMLRALPRLDFDRAWDLVENHALPNPIFDELLRSYCATALIPTNLDEAATIAETLPTPGDRSGFYRIASDALPRSDRARKLDLLDRAMRHARAETNAVRKVEELGLIGYRLLDLGETGRGTQALREGQRLAETLRQVPARGRFASKLARIDARAALALTEGFPEPQKSRFRGGIALALADRDPAASEQAFAKLTARALHDGAVIRAVGRMAPIDRARARRLVVTLDNPRYRAIALGVMARSLIEADPKAAAGLIDEVLGRLVTLALADGDTRLPRDSVIAGELLPTAERVDPDLLRRCFWRAVALRPPRPSGGDSTGLNDRELAKLAMTLARYDRDVARQVLEPAAARARSFIDRAPAMRGHEVFAAAAAIDPAGAAALADALPDDAPGSPTHPRATVRRVIALVLAHDGPERWEHLEGFFVRVFGSDSRDVEW